MVAFKNLHINTQQNAQILASAAETFGAAAADKEARTKHGSFNFLTIFNQSAEKITIELDGDSTRSFELFGNATFGLLAEEGFFFDWIVITNQSAVNAIAANKIRLTYGRGIPIPGT